uniref:Chemerin chemokine-like receptor 1 n=2 Tax=Tetraodon nigroviridis TaxID=99883 RepID=H3CUK1_TETNG
LLVAINIAISVFGLAGNSVVIWICGCKMKRTVITTWYISLAVSDLLFCALLPLEVYYNITLHWPFGLVLCKLASSAMFLNMYSSVFLLVLISMDRCLMVFFPVWSHNPFVALVWLLSALLTFPSMIFRQVTAHGAVTQCHTNYTSHSTHEAVVLVRFTCGFLIPFLMIVCCCLLFAVKLRSLTIRSSKPYKVIAALILSFFSCWVPYHSFIFLELDLKNNSVEIIQTGLKVGATLAAANSFVSPFLYVFVGNNFKQMLKHSWKSRMEEAAGED